MKDREIGRWRRDPTPPKSPYTARTKAAHGKRATGFRVVGGKSGGAGASFSHSPIMIRPFFAVCHGLGFGRLAGWLSARGPTEEKVCSSQSRRCHWRAVSSCSSLVRRVLADTKHQYVSCVSSVDLLCCQYPFPCSLASHHPHRSFSVSAVLQAYNYHQRDVAYGLPSHLLGQSLHQLGSAIYLRYTTFDSLLAQSLPPL